LKHNSDYTDQPAIRERIYHDFLQSHLSHCQGEPDAGCVWKYLQSKDKFLSANAPNQDAYSVQIRQRVSDCFQESFETNGEPLNPMLHDNKLLRVELEQSKKVSAYENFPFLKINGVSYTGKINIHDVKL
jgi:hypothetical protein